MLESAGSLEVDILIEDVKSKANQSNNLFVSLQNPVRDNRMLVEVFSQNRGTGSLVVCDFLGNCQTFDLGKIGKAETIKVEQEISMLKQGVGCYWVTVGADRASGIVIIK